MRHLFILNPTADKLAGKVKPIVENIEGFFQSNAQIDYDIHITRWSRDAVGYIRRYVASAEEIVRVHVFGGSGTLFEAVNGVIGLPNVQVAAYPMGRSNDFLRYFGENRLHLFSSLRNQIFSGVTAIDCIRCGSNYGISFGLVGIEAASDRDGTDMIEKTSLPTDFCYLWSAMSNIFSNKRLSQSYKILLDGKPLDGEYITMMIANGPCYGKDMSPAVDAHPNDGIFEVYLMKDMSKFGLISTIPAYVSGNYRKFPDRISHYSGSKISISSDSIMCMSMDGEPFYENRVEYEIIPYAIDFVCPNGIDMNKIPRIFGMPENVIEGGSGSVSQRRRQG